MFSHLTLEGEIERFRLVPKPDWSCIFYREDQLCRNFLYHYVVRNGGIFTDAAILHLHCTNLPLTTGEWTMDFRNLYLRNHACLYILTDGEFDIPPSWVKRGIKYRVYTYSRLKFHTTRYKQMHSWDKQRMHILDVITTSPVKRGQEDPTTFDFGFRILKLHNPAIYNYRVPLKERRDFRESTTGPYGDPPQPPQP